MAAELVNAGVTVLATGGAEFPVFAAKTAAAKAEIPVVFVMGGDPVALGIVPSLARPAGTTTGISMLTSALENKRFGLLHEIVPAAKTVAALIDASRALAPTQIAELQDAALHAGVRLIVVNSNAGIDVEFSFRGCGWPRCRRHPNRRQSTILPPGGSRSSLSRRKAGFQRSMNGGILPTRAA